MYKNLKWKFVAIVAVAALAVVAFYPPRTKIKLGLDLKGGIHLVLRVQTTDALQTETDTSSEQLKAALTTAGISPARIAPSGPTTFVVEGVPPDRDQQFRQVAEEQVGAAYNRESAAAGSYTFRLKPNVEAQLRRDAVTQAIQTIDRRVNELGIAEPIVAEYGNSGDQIVVELPGLTDIARAEGLIQSTAVLELKIVQAGPAPDQQSLLSATGGQVPPDMEVVTGSTAAAGQPPATKFYLVNKVAAITGRDLRSAKPTIGDFNEPAVAFTLNSDGAAKFGRVTSANVGRQLAILLDNRVYSDPVIETAIMQAEARITGTFTQQEVNDLALVLRSGALPASLHYLERREVGPSLGQDSIEAGIKASLAGLILVTLFMLVYYKLAGINAIVSVAMNLTILMGFMAYLGAAMTLPGIAGFLLTIGIGVDSNVLIFERIREEIAAGKSARQAVAAGFDRVFVTILDTHIASLISAAFLFQFGTGPIRGFATTLFFGLISNVFTAVFVSRTLFEFTLSRRPGTAKLSI